MRLGPGERRLYGTEGVCRRNMGTALDEGWPNIGAPNEDKAALRRSGSGDGDLARYGAAVPGGEGD